MEKQTLATVTSESASGDEPSMTITTVALDRARDEVVPEGGDFAAYLKNPVVLFGHDHHGLPVGTTTQLDVTPGRGIRARWRWLEGDPFADRVRNAFEQGMLRAASIGFLPRESERNGQGGQRFTDWELLEWSLVAIPANPDAVRVLRSLDLWPGGDDVALDLDDVALDLKDADILDVEGFSRAELDELTRRASELTRGRLQRRGEPFGDPAARRHERDDEVVCDVDPEDLRRILRGVVEATLADVVRRETAAALARARGRVD